MPGKSQMIGNPVFSQLSQMFPISERSVGDYRRWNKPCWNSAPTKFNLAKIETCNSIIINEKELMLCRSQFICILALVKERLAILEQQIACVAGAGVKWSASWRGACEEENTRARENACLKGRQKSLPPPMILRDGFILIFQTSSICTSNFPVRTGDGTNAEIFLSV